VSQDRPLAERGQARARPVERVGVAIETKQETAG
jgi:hypothetical protein